MLRKIVFFGKSHYLAILFFTGIYFLFVINSFHEKYPDEFDNILGGHLINHGILPYVGFFSHHGPVSYYLASILTIFSNQSFVLFRFLTTIFYLLLLLLTFFLLKRIKGIKTNFFLIYTLVLAISSTYFWGHMFLADPISGYLLIPAYGILFLKMYLDKKLERADIIFISGFSFMAVLNSITYIYAVFIVIATSFIYFVVKEGIVFRKISIFILVCLAPYLFFLLYLFLTRSFQDYYFQAIIYNKDYYIYNYPRAPGSGTFINPIRYAIVIFNSFVNAYQPLLAGIKDFTLMNPFNVTLALSNLLLWLFLLVKRKYLLFFFVFLIIVYVNVRSDPLTLRVTSYQNAVYIMLTFFNASFLIFVLKDELNTIKNYLAHKFLLFLTLLFLAYWFFNLLFVSAELWRMTYNRYMGEMPLIYDKPQVAYIINAAVPKEDYCWVGPFELEELLYLNCKLPSRYHWILPQFTGIEKIKSELLENYSRNKADIIVYKRRFETFGATAAFGKFFTDFLDEKYVRLKDINSYKKYHFKNSQTLNFRLDEDFNFEKTKAGELINSLIQKGYIEEIK